jgi:hypothetical protein
MASARFYSPNAFAQYRAQGWRDVPGNGRVPYDPDSFDPADPLGLYLLKLDRYGRSRLGAGWQDAEVRSLARATCAAIMAGDSCH